MKIEITLDGSPEEILNGLATLLATKAFSGLIESNQENKTIEIATKDEEQTNPKEIPILTYEEAERVLNYRSLNRNQIIMLRSLVEAGSEYVSSNELMHRTGLTLREFGGFMGGWKMRMIRGLGKKTFGDFIEQYWDDDEKCNFYRLTNTAFEDVMNSGIPELGDVGFSSEKGHHVFYRHR